MDSYFQIQPICLHNYLALHGGIFRERLASCPGVGGAAWPPNVIETDVNRRLYAPEKIEKEFVILDIDRPTLWTGQLQQITIVYIFVRLIVTGMC